MTQQSRGRSGQFTWRMGNGVPLTWMPIGTPLWKAGLYRNLFVFLMERSRHQARLSSAQTQTARTAKLSRNTYSMSFTRLSRKTCRMTSVSTRFGFCWIEWLVRVIDHFAHPLVATQNKRFSGRTRLSKNSIFSNSSARGREIGARNGASPLNVPM